MTRHHAQQRALVVLLLLTLPPLAAPASAAAAWQPSPSDWPMYRGHADRSGLAAVPSAFSPNPADLRIKWSHNADPGYWVPPVAADLDHDGVAEVVATIGNASVQPDNAANPIVLTSGVEVLDGATGALRWRYGPNTGNLDFFSPALGDVDGDGVGDIVFLDGNPLVGTFATNKVLAYRANGQKLWEWSDAAWGSKTPVPLNGMAVGNVDGDSGRPEAVGLVLLATVTTHVEGSKVFIEFSDPEHRLVALNGEGGGSLSWQRVLPNGTANTPALADLDGDGVLDVVFGSGIKPGAILDSDNAAISFGETFAAHKLHAYAGGASSTLLWDADTGTFNGGELLSAPAIADLDGDGKPDVVQPLWDRATNDTERDHTRILALRNSGSTLWRVDLPATVVAPAALGDLDGDGAADVLVETLDGNAADQHRVIAFRGATGQELWRTGEHRYLTSSPVIGDLTGDGRPDVVLTTIHGDGKSYLLVLDGATGTQTFETAVAPGLSLGGPLLVDLDGDDDGRPELIVHTGEWGEPGRMFALEPELPDLEVHDADLTLDASPVFLGEPTTARAVVHNTGSRTASHVQVRFDDGGQRFAERTLDALAPGAQATVEAPWTPASAGSHTLRVAVDEGKAIPEWVETNNQGSLAVSVKVSDLALAPADFRVLAEGVPVAEAPEGRAVTLEAQVHNLGDGRAQNVVVRFQDGATDLGTVSVGTVAAGSSATATLDGIALAAGNHTLTARADPDDAVTERDESNNVASKALRVRLADLQLQAADFEVPTQAVNEGSTVTLRATLRNLGGKDAPDVVVRFFDDGQPFAERSLALLAVGANATLSADLAVTGAFEHTVAVVADPDASVPEEDEANNAASKRLAVRFVAPDLAIEAANITFDPEQPLPGDAVVVHARVANVGERALDTGFAVTFLHEGVAFATQQGPALAAGADATVDATWTAVDPPGAHALTVRVDPDDQVIELRESNNEATATLRLRGPDLVVRSITVPDHSPSRDVEAGQAEPGDATPLEAVIANEGDGPSVPAQVEFRVDGAAAGTAMAPALAAGSEATVSVTWTATLPYTTHPLRAEADVTGTNVEHDEANNAADGSVEVVFRAADLALAAPDLRLSDPNPDDTGPLTITATVHNRGDDLKTVRGVVVRALDDGAEVARGVLAEVPSGENRSIALTFFIAGVGPHDLTVEVDPDQAIVERDDTNNAARASAVVGKVRVDVQVSQPAYDLQTQAQGTVTLRFNKTGAPLARQPFALEVAYVVRVPSDSVPGGPELFRFLAQVAALVHATVDQDTTVCAAGKCVHAGLSEDVSLFRDLGIGNVVDDDGIEVTYLLWHQDGRTNAAGEAHFEVPFDLLQAFDSVRGSSAAEVCSSLVDDALTAAGLNPLGCVARAASLPALPGRANLPGRHRASAATDWFGFGFRGAVDYQDLPAAPPLPPAPPLPVPEVP